MTLRVLLKQLFVSDCVTAHVRFPDTRRCFEELTFRGIEVDLIVFEILVCTAAPPPPHSSFPTTTFSARTLLFRFVIYMR